MFQCCRVMLVLQPLIFQRNERVAITVAISRLIAGCTSIHKRHKNAGDADVRQAGAEPFFHLITNHGGPIPLASPTIIQQKQNHGNSFLAEVYAESIILSTHSPCRNMRCRMRFGQLLKKVEGEKSPEIKAFRASAKPSRCARRGLAACSPLFQNSHDPATEVTLRAFTA